MYGRFCAKTTHVLLQLSGRSQMLLGLVGRKCASSNISKGERTNFLRVYSKHARLTESYGSY